uniref:Uncharacterized protein n=1 Tax=Meloidogyne incognita TaxID=6306 RepID=A0A914L0F5_MELIC
MRVHVTLFLLTILLEFVSGMRREAPSTSYSHENVTEQGVQRAMNVQGRGGRLPIEILFEQVAKSLQIEKNEVYEGNELYTKIVDEGMIIRHFLNLNNESENSHSEEFVILLFKEFINARKVYREALIKQKNKKKTLKKIINIMKNKSLETKCK